MVYSYLHIDHIVVSLLFPPEKKTASSFFWTRSVTFIKWEASHAAIALPQRALRDGPVLKLRNQNNNEFFGKNTILNYVLRVMFNIKPRKKTKTRKLLFWSSIPFCKNSPCQAGQIVDFHAALWQRTEKSHQNLLNKPQQWTDLIEWRQIPSCTSPTASLLVESYLCYQKPLEPDLVLWRSVSMIPLA